MTYRIPTLSAGAHSQRVARIHELAARLQHRYVCAYAHGQWQIYDCRLQCVVRGGPGWTHAACVEFFESYVSSFPTLFSGTTPSAPPRPLVVAAPCVPPCPPMPAGAEAGR